MSTEHEASFFAVAIDLLCCLDFNGYFKLLNPAWERTLGFTIEELMSRPSIEFVHPDDRERTLAQNGDVREGGHALAFENRYRCKDGSYRWLRWNAAPHLTGETIYSVARDITAWKEAEAERNQLVSELQAGAGRGAAARDDPADLLVLQEDPRRRQRLAKRRVLHRETHEHAVQP